MRLHPYFPSYIKGRCIQYYSTDHPFPLYLTYCCDAPYASQTLKEKAVDTCSSTVRCSHGMICAYFLQGTISTLTRPHTQVDGRCGLVKKIRSSFQRNHLEGRIGELDDTTFSLPRICKTSRTKAEGTFQLSLMNTTKLFYASWVLFATLRFSYTRPSRPAIGDCHHARKAMVFLQCHHIENSWTRKVRSNSSAGRLKSIVACSGMVPALSWPHALQRL
jgi:arsenate reductase-like glutaredoxin family protein